jgi:predicted glycosyltransferase
VGYEYPREYRKEHDYVETVIVRILFNMGHPGQFHLFKHAIRLLEKNGHACRITCIRKDVLLALLDAGGYRYTVIGSFSSTLLGKMIEQILIEARLYREVRDFAPDILVGGTGSVAVAHVGTLARIPSVVFDDTEHARIEHTLLDPFVSTLCTPSCYRGDIGERQVRYNGYHELAYLHPAYFTPDITVLSEIGLASGDPFIVVRFVSWDASHDIGHHGILDRAGLVKALEPYGRVLITSEGPLPPEFEKYRIRLSPEKMHDLLSFARLYIGEGATMASEAALLGTPSLLVSSLVGTMGNFLELEKTYDLMYSFSDGGSALKMALDILSDPDSKRVWAKKRERLLEDKIDVTAFIVWFIENYPRSFDEMKVSQKTS